MSIISLSFPSILVVFFPNSEVLCSCQSLDGRTANGYRIQDSQLVSHLICFLLLIVHSCAPVVEGIVSSADIVKVDDVISNAYHVLSRDHTQGLIWLQHLPPQWFMTPVRTTSTHTCVQNYTQRWIHTVHIDITYIYIYRNTYICTYICRCERKGRERARVHAGQWRACGGRWCSNSHSCPIDSAECSTLW